MLDPKRATSSGQYQIVSRTAQRMCIRLENWMSHVNTSSYFLWDLSATSFGIGIKKVYARNKCLGTADLDPSVLLDVAWSANKSQVIVRFSCFHIKVCM